jgi:hypothetical protein
MNRDECYSIIFDKPRVSDHEWREEYKGKEFYQSNTLERIARLESLELAKKLVAVLSADGYAYWSIAKENDSFHRNVILSSGAPINMEISHQLDELHRKINEEKMIAEEMKLPEMEVKYQKVLDGVELKVTLTRGAEVYKDHGSVRRSHSITLTKGGKEWRFWPNNYITKDDRIRKQKFETEMRRYAGDGLSAAFKEQLLGELRALRAALEGDLK